MSNFHFNINYKLKSKADSRSILKLDSLRSSVTPTFQPKGLEHILIKRMCDGKLTQKDLMTQLFSKQSSQAVLSKQKGFYYNDQHEIASVKEFFHFYKLVSSEKNNIQRQDFNEQLQKKTEKIINMLHDKNQNIKEKERQQTSYEEFPTKSQQILTHHSLKDLQLSNLQSSSISNKQKNVESSLQQSKINTVVEPIQNRKPSIDFLHQNNMLEFQKKSSLKSQTQRKLIQATDQQNLTNQQTFQPNIKQNQRQEEVFPSIPTSPIAYPLASNSSIPYGSPNILTLGSSGSIPSQLNIPTQLKAVIKHQDLSKYRVQKLEPLTEQITPNKQVQNNKTSDFNSVSERNVKSAQKFRVKELNLSDLSQSKQFVSTVCNTTSLRNNQKPPTPTRSSHQSEHVHKSSYDKVGFTPLLTSQTAQTTEERPSSSIIPGIQSPIEFKNSKIQQLLNDFNDSVLELEPQTAIQQNKQFKQEVDQLYQGDFINEEKLNNLQLTNNNSQKSIVFKGLSKTNLSRNNSITSYPYLDFPVSSQNIKDSKIDKQALVSFSLPQSDQKPSQKEQINNLDKQQIIPQSMLNLQHNSLNESLTGIRGRVRSYSPKQVAKTFNQLHHSDDELLGDEEKNEVARSMLQSKEMSLQFTMKHADKFLQTHDSLAGSKVANVAKDRKMQFIGTVFKNALNFDIMISNQISHSVDRKRKQIQSGSKVSMASKASQNEISHDQIKEIDANDDEVISRYDAAESRKEIGYSQESYQDLPSLNSIPKRMKVSADISRVRTKNNISFKDNMEEIQEDVEEKPKTPFLVVQKLKQENLLGNTYEYKAIQNLDKDINQTISKIDTLLARKAALNMGNDKKERKTSPLSYTQKKFNTRAEVGRHFDVQKYFNIQKTIAIDYSTARKNIMIQQFDNKVYTKPSDYVNHYL